jgi:hypothetical protein
LTGQQIAAALPSIYSRGASTSLNSADEPHLPSLSEPYTAGPAVPLAALTVSVEPAVVGQVVLFNLDNSFRPGNAYVSFDASAGTEENIPVSDSNLFDGRIAVAPATCLTPPPPPPLPVTPSLPPSGPDSPSSVAGDSDGDEFSDTLENHVGTSPSWYCAPIGWPVDFNDDAAVSAFDLSAIAGPIGRTVPPAPVRADIAPEPTGSNTITAADLSKAAGRIGRTCPKKTIFFNRWYQRLEDTGSYANWMTLAGHRHYQNDDPNLQNLWASPVTTGLDGWNNANLAGGKTTVAISDYAPQFWHDAHVWVSQDGCWLDLDSDGNGTPDISNCTSFAGEVFRYDRAFPFCNGGPDFSQCPPTFNPSVRDDNWWYVIAAVSESRFQIFYGGRTAADQNFIRTAIAAHELGHAIVLAHDRKSWGPGDPRFPVRLRHTCNDYGRGLW